MSLPPVSSKSPKRVLGLGSFPVPVIILTYQPMRSFQLKRLRCDGYHNGVACYGIILLQEERNVADNLLDPWQNLACRGIKTPREQKGYLSGK
jgi:hypothetical protein